MRTFSAFSYANLISLSQVEYNVAESLGGIVNVEQLVHKANFLFLEDQRKQNGDASLCCASSKPIDERIICNGTANICQVSFSFCYWNHVSDLYFSFK
jgi:hypothetical protein